MSTQTPPSADVDSVLADQAKQVLRSRMRMLRDATPKSACKRRSVLACENAARHVDLHKATCIAFYAAKGSELNALSLVEDALARGQTVCFPRLDQAQRAMIFHRVSDLTQMQTGAFGVSEPAATLPVVPPEALELMLVPALAADARGYRIGYGQGYYDRVLAQTPNTVSVCLLYHFQLLAEVPILPHDRSVDWVITDQAALYTR